MDKHGEKMHEQGHLMLKVSVGLLGAIITLMTSYFIWSSNTLLAVDKNVGVLSTKMEHYTKTLEIYAKNQYTKDEAAADKKLMEYEIEAINKRLDRIESAK